MQENWKGYDWVLFVIRLLVFVSVLYNVSVVKEQLFLPYWAILFAIGLSYIVPFLLLLKNRKLYFIAEIAFLLALTPVFALIDTTLVGNFVTYSIMIGYYQDQQTKRWSIPVSAATLLLCPLPALTISPVSYISVVISGGVFYGLGIVFNVLSYTKEEVRKKNKIIEQQYKVLEQYSRQVEQNTILQERNRISLTMQDSVSHTFSSLLFRMEEVQKQVEGNHARDLITELIRYTYEGLSEVRNAIQQLDQLDVEIPVKEMMMNIIENVQQSTNIPVEFVLKGEEKPVSKRIIFTLQKCLQELLTNAIKTGNATRIAVTLQFDEEFLELRMQDDGKGSEQARMDGGIGKLVEQLTVLKGEFQLSSFLDKGVVAACKVPHSDAKHEGAITVLVVDPHPIVRESLINILEISNLSIIGSAETSEEAVQICESTNPDVILVDSDLGNENLILKVKKLSPDCKIIVLTSNNIVEEAIEAIHAGAEGYLSKSIPSRDLITRINLVHLGETIVSRTIAKQLVEQMKTVNPTRDRKEKWKQNHGLTDREAEVLQCLAEGLKYKEISERLFLAEGTVRNYISNIYSKLEVNDRDQATQKALEGDNL